VQGIGGGDINRGRRVGRHRHDQGERVTVAFPGRGDAAMDGIVIAPGKAEFVAGLRADDDVLVARRVHVPADAGDAVVEPFAAGSQRVVVERVHAGILEAFLRGPAVPAFPDGGGPVFD